MAVWQIDGHRYVVASDGRRVNSVDPAKFGSLPLVIGQGANTDAARVIPLVLNHPRLASRIQALRRVDGRRWDVLLKSNGVILLPAGDEGSALDRLDRLDAQSGLLGLNLARIDLRNAAFTVVRPFPAPVAAPISHGV